MIADHGWSFSLPSVLLGPVNSSSKFADRYRRIPNGWAFVIAAVASLTLAVFCGILGGLAGAILYDGGMSRGDDFAVSLGGFYSIGAFTFVVLFTWLQKIHHPVSSRTSLFAFFPCLILPIWLTLTTLPDDHYLPFVLGDWGAILLFGFLSLFVCRRWWWHSDSGL
jgi:hypothetical protein